MLRRARAIAILARRSLRSRVLVVLALFVLPLLTGCEVPSQRDRLTRAVAEPSDSQVADPPGVELWRGSLLRPRGGPYLFGFWSEGEARLTLGDRELRGRGLVMQRLIVEEPGAVALRFAAPPGARLLWSPAGRRGTPEYIPPSSLSPDPPHAARFETSGWSAAGTARTKGVIAAALALAILAGVLGLARHRLRRVERATWYAMAGVFAVALLVRLIGLDAAGATWDEDVYWSAGRNYVENLLALDFDPALWQWNPEHPPITKYLAGIPALFVDEYGPARALSAVQLALACALLVPIGQRLGGHRSAGLLAGVFAALTPHLVAHGKIVGHEAPSLLWWNLGVLLALTLHDAGRAGAHPSRRVLLWRLVGLGVVVGLAAGTRFIAGLLGPMVLIAAVAFAPLGRRLATFALTCAVVPAMSIATFIATWPLLWGDPVGRLFGSWSKLRIPHALEPFGGALTNAPPASYFVAYLLATSPLVLLAGAAVFLVHALRRRGDGSDGPKRRAALVTFAWLLLPLVVVLSPVRQDGVRYVLSSAMALGLAAALGFAALWAWGRRQGAPPWQPRAAIAVVVAVVAHLGWSCLRAHPYPLDYYNEWTGGPGEVSRHRRFETAWWGEGLDRAVDYVNRHAAHRASVSRSCVVPTHLTWFRGDLWARMVDDPSAAEWIVTYAPATTPCAIPADATRVFAVVHQGLVLAEVYRRGPIAPSVAPAAPVIGPRR